MGIVPGKKCKLSLTGPGGRQTAAAQDAPAKTLAEGNGKTFISRDVLAKTQGQ